ncbi:MAG TPA: protein kinase [Bryobacteraceae bacterium]|nr:protein kinase [Bryobacteraceae bacterium]
MDSDTLTGQSFAQYKILSKLGEGGMGVVYKALDMHLERAVALKLLPADKMADPQAKSRFAQEAKTASSLNHPNIVTIYDIGESEGFLYIAMECVAGKTLARHIRGKGLSVADALKYAVQIADALAAAHEAGVVHRDLKPGNIMITDRGLVKLLDFGLAKVTGRLPRDAVTATIATDGAVVGTAAYMSPEHASGEPVDARSDIFSFGVVLYEMLAGKRPFTGPNSVAILAAILQGEPEPVVTVAPDVPDELARLVHLCLRKDPSRRPQHMDDLRMMLEELQSDSQTGRILSARVTPAVRSRFPATPVLKIAVGALLTLFVAVAGFLAWRSGVRNPTPPPVLSRLTSDTGLTAFPALSPDGKLLAYASDRQGTGNLHIWVQQVGASEPIPLTTDTADDYAPSFSPDGTRIVFRSEREGGGVYVIGALGGEARLVAAGGRQPVFSPDGAWIAYWVGAIDTGVIPGSAKLYVIPSAGGQPRQVQPDFLAARHPVWMHDGKRLLFFGRIGRELEADWWVAPVDGGKAARTGAFAVFKQQNLTARPGEYVVTPDALSSDDQVYFSATSGDSTNLWRIALSPSTGRVSGEASQVTFGTGLEVQPAIADTPGGAQLVFAGLNLNVDVFALPADTNQGRVTGGRERLTKGTAEHAWGPSISADGQMLVFLSKRSGVPNVWVRDLKAGKEAAVTSGMLEKTEPRISADGLEIAYAELHEGNHSPFLVSAKGGAAMRLCETTCGVPTDVSTDGSRILMESDEAPDAVVLKELHAGAQTNLISLPRTRGFFPFSGRFSPDQRWISFHARSGNPAVRKVFIAPFRGAQVIPEHEWIPVTDGTTMDRETFWSPDGNLLYFLSERDGFRCIWAQRLDPETKRPIGQTFAVMHFHHPRDSLTSVANGNPASVGLSVIKGRIIFAMGDLTGNIWASVRK